MDELTLVVGNKNYSSWSLRPYVVLKHIGVPFREVVVPLDQPDTAQRIGRHSPSGRVPALLHGKITVWDSLAICEYLNETFPAAKLLPEDREARATARSVSAEMHAGFADLRQALPMNLRASKPGRELAPGVRKDIDRVVSIWETCRGRFGTGGPFLFGQFSYADAMYAPVVGRFRTYGVPLAGAAAAYSDALWGHPGVVAWVEAARQEPWALEKYDR